MTTNPSSRSAIRPAALVLADGSVFEGEAFGATPESGMTTGEVVFNTSLTGYQEITTDPSYAGQIVTFTYPHIGNYGVTPDDEESDRVFCRGVIVRDIATRRSNWRSVGDYDDYLSRAGTAGISGIDTRRLARIVRDHGALGGAFGPLDATTVEALTAAAASEVGTTGIDLVSEVTTAEPYTHGDGAFRVSAYDFGIKRSILEQLAEFATVRVFPASATAADLLDAEPDGIFLSNGPGDPEMVSAVSEVRTLLETSTVPLFGICLGHQVLALAAGAATVKLPFGHHGGNHPVREVSTGRIDISSHNHNFAVDADSLDGVATLTHTNLNDGVCEGMRLNGINAWSVQHHPEAGPGPHEARSLFASFRDAMEEN